jgi:aspartyl/asparaginyl beta-hydroxylase (cupin superfamily)
VPAGGIVRPHTYSHSRIRNQLALVVPEVTPEDEVYIQVGGEKRGWELGKTITFDDSVMHDVKNLSKHNRIVLLYDFKP